MASARLTAWLRLLLPCLCFLFLSPDYASSGRRSSQIDGVTYEHYVVDEVPWSIHVIKIDRSRPDFEIVTTLGGGSRIGLSSLTRQLRTVPRDLGTPIAAINGDFYSLEHDNYPGDPRGLHILRGELVSDPTQRTCIWFDESRNPHMGDVASRFSVTWPNGESTPFGLNEERANAGERSRDNAGERSRDNAGERSRDNAGERSRDNAGGRSSNAAVLYTSAVGESTQTRGGTELILEKVSTNKWLPLKPEVTFPARVREIRQSGNSPVAPDTLVLSIASHPPRRPPTVEVGDILVFSTFTDPSLKGVPTAVGGGPALVHGGKASPGRALKAYERHPRSAVGWNSKYIFFVEVDGRQPGLSMGMDVRELADFMVQIGCDEGMNLDGGGSAEVWLNGEIMNSPCFGRERSTATAIVLLKKKVQVQP